MYDIDRSIRTRYIVVSCCSIVTNSVCTHMLHVQSLLPFKPVLLPVAPGSTCPFVESQNTIGRKNAMPCTLCSWTFDRYATGKARHESAILHYAFKSSVRSSDTPGACQLSTGCSQREWHGRRHLGSSDWPSRAILVLVPLKDSAGGGKALMNFMEGHFPEVWHVLVASCS